MRAYSPEGPVLRGENSGSIFRVVVSSGGNRRAMATAASVGKD